jgi:amino acid adenylation domain-containing protein
MNQGPSFLDNLLQEWSSRWHDHVAVNSQDRPTTYGELARGVSRLSKWLLTREIGPETPVAVCADRTANWIIGAFGTMHAGGLYIPVDPTTPLRRKIEILGDASVSLVLTEPNLLSGLPPRISHAMIDSVAAAQKSQRRFDIFPDQAAYGIYTSGSTGAPKCTIVSHKSLENYATVLRHEFSLNEADRYLHTASAAFSASIRQLIGPLTSGATVVIGSRDEIRNPESLILRMLQTKVTIFDTVPSYLEKWMASVLDSPREWRERLTSSLRLVLTTGEVLPSKVAESLRNLLPKTRLINLYGQTETTGSVSTYEVSGNESEPIPVGRCLWPSSFYVLDEDLNETDEGELYVSGPCLARCYRGRPELTAATFRPDPFSPASGARMCRTGDRVRRNGNGLIEFKGRNDGQVKIHGVRIELNEVDAVFLSHPDIVEAVTVFRPVGGPDLRLVAFLATRADRPSPTTENVRMLLATTLSDVAIPGIIIFLDSLPRTLSGKIDRQELINRDVSSSIARVSLGGPNTPTELLVAKCWGELLSIEGVGADDDFFALGGDSLQAMTMTLQLQKLLPVQLPLAGMFLEDPSLRAFASAIDNELQSTAVMENDSQA